MQYIGCGACDTKGQWAALMSHNGIVRERVGENGRGGERNLHNSIDNTNCLVIFGVSRGYGAVRASMTRPPPHAHHGQGSRGTLLRRRSASSSLLCPSN
jgi:hypothetical protein